MISGVKARRMPTELGTEDEEPEGLGVTSPPFIWRECCEGPQVIHVGK